MFTVMLFQVLWTQDSEMRSNKAATDERLVQGMDAGQTRTYIVIDALNRCTDCRLSPSIP